MSTCSTCAGAGLVWRSANTTRRARVNEDGEPCMAAFRCPTCPDDGSGNSVGTGVVEDVTDFRDAIARAAS